MLDQQEIEGFIGREREIELYQRWLDAPLPMDGQISPWVLYFYDQSDKKGGIGKTWLLRHLMGLTKETHKDVVVVIIDFFDVPDRGGVAIARRVAEQIQKVYPQWLPMTFIKANQEYQDRLDAGSVDVALLRVQLFGALTLDLQRLVAYLDQNKRTLVIFFDTFELVEKDPVIAVLEAGRTFPDSYHFKQIGVVIAGRNPIDWSHQNWRGREQEVQSVAMNPFSREEMERYIATRSFVQFDADEQMRTTLYERTEGRPILIGLAIDVLNYHLMSLEDLLNVSQVRFEETLVTRINNLENPTNWIILFMAHAYHRFNFTLLDWMLSESQLQNLVQADKRQSFERTLPALSFVRRSSTSADFVLHDEMRRLITRYCWNTQDSDQRNRREVSRATILYYEHALAQLGNKNDVLYQTYIVEKLYHQLYMDTEKGLAAFKEYFVMAMGSWQRVYARSLIHEVRGVSRFLSLDQLCDLDLLEAGLFQREENYLAELNIYNNLEQKAQPSWLDKHRADIYYGMGYVYRYRSNFPQARDYFTRCLELDRMAKNEERIAEILGMLGYVSRRQGNLELALQYYSESIALHREQDNMREYSDVLNNMGNALRLQGKWEEAKRYCKISVRTREKFFASGKGGEVPIGFSLAVLGTIYLNTEDLKQAELYFQQAFEIYERNNYNLGIASICNRFGAVQQKRNDLTGAMRWFKKAEEIAVDYHREEYINSLNKQGRVLIEQQKWQEALIQLEQAIEFAHQIEDFYQEVESRIDMARAFEQLGKHSASQDELQRAEEIALRYSYNYLLGTIKLFQGTLTFQARQYHVAFRYLVEGCGAMAQFNRVSLMEAINKLIDLLLEADIPVSEISTIILNLELYWHQQNFKQDYPELLDALEKVKGLLVL